jgi:hypothetical protein
MNILFLEDRASATENIEQILKYDLGHNVFSASYIYEANEIISSNDIDLYIIDLNIPPDGLPKNRLNSELYPGWLWVMDNVLLKNKTKYRNLKIPVIIYSEYIKDLNKQYNQKLELSSEEWEFYNRVTIIKKASEANILEEIEKILNNLRNL